MNFDLIEIDDRTRRVVLHGRGDAAGIDGIETSFTASVANAGRNTVLDLSDVPFMGSLGIRMLISCARVMTRRGAKLVLFGVQPAVMEVFETVTLGEMIPIAGDEAAALALLTT
jgi:anti-anti-sigma factor